MENHTAIGIDLGTTYSCVAAYLNGTVEIFTNASGNRTTPSYVLITGDDHYVGEIAKNSCISNERNTIFDSKRLIGRKYDDPIVQEDKKLWPFAVLKQCDQLKIEIFVEGKSRTFFPDEISTMLLNEMKKKAEEQLGQKVSHAVITVPVHFDISQRDATINAAKNAGLEVLEIINEPTAAVLAYKHTNTIAKECNVLVYDLGGGTFDVSIFEMKGIDMNIIATGGDGHLGGEDFSNCMLIYLMKKMENNLSIDMESVCLERKNVILRRLRNRCELAKKTLSSAASAEISMDNIIDNKNFSVTLYRSQFEQINDDYFQKTMDIVEKCLQDANLKKTDIDEIILVGGSSRIPRIQNLLQSFFDGKTLNDTINPDEVVAYGAAIHATNLLEKRQS